MLIVLVYANVKPEFVEAFREASRENARASLLEPGVARFDVIQQFDDPTRFVLFEAYRNDEAPALHKDTSHYKQWRDAVAGMMADPRSGVRYTEVYPDAAAW